MSNIFNVVKMARPSRNVFDLSHDVKLSCNMGQLIPIMITEVVPGDKFNISCESLLRFSPLVSPVMHRMDVYMHYFFVPNRILWKNWENFITNTPLESTDELPAFPTLDVSDFNYSPLHDYLGIPNPIASNVERVSALPFAAYQKIFDEYYRDQNLQTIVTPELVDGDNTANSFLWNMRYRAWEHDYFTSCLPFAQKGAPVEIPLGNFNDVPVKVNNSDPGNTTFNSAPENAVAENDSTFEGDDILNFGLYASTSDLNIESATINDLRLAFKLQEWLEKQARGGSRYFENILVQFGVKSPDSRLQRPEYITGIKSPVVISEVLNTTGTSELPQGNMAGHALAVSSGRYGRYYAQEHGYIIGIMSVMPKTAYMQGIPKHFLKTQDPFQYLWPSFAHLGEQPVLNKEVYAFQGASGNDTFGYLPNYMEYRFENNRVAGKMRTTLDFWHLARKFESAPALNQNFIECVPSDRIFAVQDSQAEQLICHILNKVKAVRPLPKFGTPTF